MNAHCTNCPSDTSMAAEIADQNQQLAAAWHAQEELTTALNIACALINERANPEIVTEQKMAAQNLAVELIYKALKEHGREKNAEAKILKTYRNLPASPVELEA